MATVTALAAEAGARLLRRGMHQAILGELSQDYEKTLIEVALRHSGGRRIEASHLLAVGCPVLVPPEPQFVGALGAAVCPGIRGEGNFNMLIQDPPVEVGGGVWMLGTTAYPVYLVRGDDEGMIIEGGISAIGPILSPPVGGTGDRPRVRAHGRRDPRASGPRHGHSAYARYVSRASPSWHPLWPQTVLRNEKAVSFFRQIDSLFTDALSKTGMLATESAPPPMAENRIAVDQIVREGDTIAVEDSTWTVLETPGHSDCSISLHNAARRVLVISDASGYYMPAAKTWWPNYFTGYAAYLRSLERLAGLEAEVLCLSHNGALRGAEAIRSYFAGAIATTRAIPRSNCGRGQGGQGRPADRRDPR